MFKLSPLFVALLATVAYASPAGGPPEQDDVCRPAGIDTSIHYFLQSSSVSTKVWQAEEVNTGNFNFVDLVAKTTAASGTQERNNQLWSIQPVNNGNSFAIVSAGPNSPVCANGDGGPLDSLACPTVFSTKQAAQTAQFFLTCQTCASDNKGATSCQIQSANEGQCASFLDESFNTIKLDDCSSNQPHQFWDLIAESA